MPALYRMPVFYLLALVIGGALAVGSLGRGPTEPTRSQVATAPPKPATTPPAVEPSTADDGILRTPEGLRRKVVVRGLDVIPRDVPAGRPQGLPLDYFSIHFVYGETPPGEPRLFQIGPRDGPPLGWVQADDVLEWDTRLMARPTPRQDRPALVVYRDEACARAVVRGEACPAHRNGPCPIEGEEPGEAGESTATALGLPILASVPVPVEGGTDRTIFEVASLVRDRAPIVGPAEPTPDLRPLLKRIYVAFAIDTTASMQSHIDAARTLAAELAADAVKRYGDVTLRLALIEYRDASPRYGFRVRRVAPFTDPEGFRAALNKIEAARVGDGSVDEAVLDGVDIALPAPAAAATSTTHLDWPTGRAGDLATKMLVLLGDAPDHAGDLGRAEDLAARARRAGITIAAVRVDRPDLSADERRRYREQWQTLAEGSFRPLDQATKFTEPVPPLVVSLGKGEALAGRLQAVIDDRVEHARNLAALAEAEAENRLAEYANSEGLTPEQIAPVLVDLHRGEPEPAARPDPRLNGRKAPSVRSGWIARTLRGKPLVTIDVLMSEDELNLLIRELGDLRRAATGTGRDLAELSRLGTAAAAGETAFLDVDRGDQTFAEHLLRRRGLPPARPDSLLRRSQADLLQADDLYRSALDARLRSSIAALIRRRDAIDWSDPRQIAAGMAAIPYEPLDF